MRSLICLFLLVLFSKSGLALTPADFNFELQNKATAEINVSLNTNDPRITKYQYVVRNSALSERAIISFNLQLDIPFESTQQLSPIGWGSAGCCVVDSKRTGATGIKVTGWLYDKDEARILPGSSLSGFILITTATLPGIKRYFVESFTENDTPEGEPASAEEELAIINLSNFFNNSTSGLTIGPDPVPAPINLSALIDRLTSLKHQSVPLGWLRGEEFINQLDKKLEQAKKALAEGKGFMVRKKLEQFVNELEHQRKEQEKRQHEASEKGKKEREEHSRDDKRFLDDNAFFLLKPNAEFIISRLPPKPKDKDEEKESGEGDDSGKNDPHSDKETKDNP